MANITTSLAVIIKSQPQISPYYGYGVAAVGSLDRYHAAMSQLQHCLALPYNAIPPKIDNKDNSLDGLRNEIDSWLNS